MEENKKEYSIIGKVEIGTDEYRDLIEGVIEAKQDAEQSNKLRWEQYSRANNLENELSRTKELLDKYQEFVNSNEAIKEKMKSYFLEKKMNELENDSNE